jgi:putative hydrolase of the HAD superfamily
VNAACERGALGEGRSKGLPWPRAICESVEMSTRECDWVIGFDADDTLWHNEIIFERTQTCFRALLAKYHDAAVVDRTLLATEMRNLDLYGYGVKGFTLSAIETAVALSGGKVSAEEIGEMIGRGREMLAHPVVLMEGVVEVLADLGARHRLLVITKGDLRDQERKLAKSGLGEHFRHVEITSEKNEVTYSEILRRHAIIPENFLMVGNSLRSDILPVVALGGTGVHVPCAVTWAAELVEREPVAPGRFFSIRNLRELPGVVSALTVKRNR